VALLLGRDEPSLYATALGFLLLLARDFNEEVSEGDDGDDENDNDASLASFVRAESLDRNRGVNGVSWRREGRSADSSVALRPMAYGLHRRRIHCILAMLVRADEIWRVWM
jgi:hypothetical protein